jgi:hypothetical protein
MALVSAIAASFISALSEDHYDGSVTAATISQPLRSDTLPEAFQRWLHQSRGSGYTAELIARGLEFTSWMRMVEFKFV